MNHNSPLHYESELQKVIAEAIKKLYATDISPADVLLQQTKKEFTGDCTLVVFPYTKLSNKSPEDTANAIGEYIKLSTFPLENFNVVKGFLNLSINDLFWKNFVTEISGQIGHLFSAPSKRPGFTPAYLMVEYSSPNTN